MGKKFYVTYEQVSTRTATVIADSQEEAEANFLNDYNVLDDCEDDSYIKSIVNVVEE